MSGTGETVSYYKYVAKTPQEKQDVQTKIDSLISTAAGTITVEAMVQTQGEQPIKETG